MFKNRLKEHSSWIGAVLLAYLATKIGVSSEGIIDAFGDLDKVVTLLAGFGLIATPDRGGEKDA